MVNCVQDRGTHVALTRTSDIDHKAYTMDIPMTFAEFKACFAKFQGGAHIQVAFPDLSADLREFVLSGITPEKWTEIFGEEE